MKKFLLGIRDSVSRKELPYFLAFTIGIVVLIILDVLTKYFAYWNLSSYGNVMDAVPGLFNFVLAFNNGAAWGIMADLKWLLTLLSLFVGTGIFVFYLCRFSKMPKVYALSLALIVAGAYGNLVDRIGYWAGLGIYQNGVIDFLQFAFWTSFPVFNLADSYLTIGVFLLLVAFIVSFLRGRMQRKDAAEAEIDVENLTQKVLREQSKETENGEESRSD